MMPSPMKSDHPSTVAVPSQERQKLEEAISDDDEDRRESRNVTEEEIERWNEEYNKSKGYEIDFSKVTYCSSFRPVDLDDTAYQGGRGTNRDFLARLADMALEEHNEEYETNLELGEILRANFHLSTGFAYYISFEVTDPSDGNQIIPYRAMVRYLNEEDIEVYHCAPKPSS